MDNLYKSRHTVPETNTGFYAFLGSPASVISPPASLQSFVGYVPANYNMMWWQQGYLSTPFGSGTSFFIYPGASIASGFTSPVNDTSAFHLTEDNSTGTHRCRQPFPAQISVQMETQCPVPMRVALIAKAAERTRLVLQMQACNAAGGAIADTVVTVGFDLANGVTNYDNTASTNLTLQAAAIRPLGNGWYLCQIDTVNLTTPYAGGTLWDFAIYLDNGSGSAANSTSYTGDGSSGVLLWWLSVLPTAAWNFSNSPVFFEDFNDISVIDTNNTKNAGFTWYVNNNWPNSPNPDFRNNPIITDPTPAASISVAGSVVTLFNPNPLNGVGNCFTSITTTVENAGSGYIGTVFQPPMLWEARMNFDSTQSGWGSNFFAGQTLAFWSAAQEMFSTPSNTEYVEFDVFEWGNPTALGADGSSGGHYFTNYGPGSTNIPLGTVVGCTPNSTYNNYAAMWLTTAATGASWAIQIAFVNGGFHPSNDKAYSLAGDRQPDFAPGSVSNFPVGESQHYSIMLWTPNNYTNNPGAGFSVSYDWIKVYTP